MKILLYFNIFMIALYLQSVVEDIIIGADPIADIIVLLMWICNTLLIRLGQQKAYERNVAFKGIKNPAYILA